MLRRRQRERKREIVCIDCVCVKRSITSLKYKYMIVVKAAAL